MNDDDRQPDQHGNRFPDQGHLQKWPSDAYPEDRRAAAGHMALPHNLLWLFIASAFLGMMLFAFQYCRKRQEQSARQAIYDRANAREHNAQEKARQDYRNHPRPDLDQTIRNFRFTTTKEKE